MDIRRHSHLRWLLRAYILVFCERTKATAPLSTSQVSEAGSAFVVQQNSLLPSCFGIHAHPVNYQRFPVALGVLLDRRSAYEKLFESSGSSAHLCLQLSDVHMATGITLDNLKAESVFHSWSASLAASHWLLRSWIGNSSAAVCSINGGCKASLGRLVLALVPGGCAAGITLTINFDDAQQLVGCRDEEAGEWNTSFASRGCQQKQLGKLKVPTGHSTSISR